MIVRSELRRSLTFGPSLFIHEARPMTPSGTRTVQGVAAAGGRMMLQQDRKDAGDLVRLGVHQSLPPPGKQRQMLARRLFAAMSMSVIAGWPGGDGRDPPQATDVSTFGGRVTDERRCFMLRSKLDRLAGVHSLVVCVGDADTVKADKQTSARAKSIEGLRVLYWYKLERWSNHMKYISLSSRLDRVRNSLPSVRSDEASISAKVVKRLGQDGVVRTVEYTVRSDAATPEDLAVVGQVCRLLYEAAILLHGLDEVDGERETYSTLAKFPLFKWMSHDSNPPVTYDDWGFPQEDILEREVGARWAKKFRSAWERKKS